MRGQLDDQANVVRLYVGIVSRAIAKQLAALFALVNDDVPLFRVSNRRHSLKKSAALVGAVARIDIHVKRRKTKRAMIARAFAERKHLFAAMLTNKSVIVFGKAFGFHVKKFLLYRYIFQTEG